MNISESLIYALECVINDYSNYTFPHKAREHYLNFMWKEIYKARKEEGYYEQTQESK